MAAGTNVSSNLSSQSSSADGAATIAALQDAFKAGGADVGVYPGIVNGTTLHQLVMSENNGIGPAIDEVYNSKTNISEWVLVNFQFDDMTGYIDSNEKSEMVDRFKNELLIYVEREYMKGRVVFAALPIMPCAPDKVVSSVDAAGRAVLTTYPTASKALYRAIEVAANNNVFPVDTVGGTSQPDVAHMGADCSTPDKVAQDAQIASIVDPLVERYKVALDTINKCKYNREAIPEEGRSAQCWGIEPVKK
ncbi:putative gp27 [Burkholderia pseudomallei]|nr:putative gp27 [Burkholderia pseudomallei]